MRVIAPRRGRPFVIPEAMSATSASRVEDGQPNEFVTGFPKVCEKDRSAQRVELCEGGPSLSENSGRPVQHVGDSALLLDGRNWNRQVADEGLWYPSLPPTAGHSTLTLRPYLGCPKEVQDVPHLAHAGSCAHDMKLGGASRHLRAGSGLSDLAVLEAGCDLGDEDVVPLERAVPLRYLPEWPHGVAGRRCACRCVDLSHRDERDAVTRLRPLAEWRVHVADIREPTEGCHQSIASRSRRPC